jgi:hypothetical protein
MLTLNLIGIIGVFDEEEAVSGMKVSQRENSMRLQP